MNLENINSGDDYADLLIGNMREIKDDSFHPILFEKWCDNIRQLCRIRYRDYIKEIEDTFLLTDEELKKALQDAMTSYIEEGIEELLDRDMIQMGIDEKGEVVYSLTEEGKDIAEEFDKWDEENLN